MSAINKILRGYEKRPGNSGAFKLIILALLILICMGMAYYFHFIAHEDIVFSNFFYVPIVLAGIWWGRRGVWVGVFLGACLIAAHILSRSAIPPAPDILRAVMFVVVGLVVGILKEQALKTEETTRLAYVELNQIFNASAEAMLVIDKGFNVLRINDTFSLLFGIGKDETTGKKCYNVFRGPWCHTPDCPMKRILEGEDPLEYDAQRERKDGVKIHCIFTGTPLRSHEGELIGIIEDFRDITERNHLQKRLMAAKSYAENIIANFLDTLIVTNPDGTIRTINQATLDLLEYKEEELIGKPVEIIFAEEVKPLFNDTLELVKRGVVRNYELTYVTKSGRRIPMSFNAAVMRNENNEILGLVAGAKDISQIKETEARLRQAQKMEAIGTLAGGVAHDFNNLLTIIMGNAELALEELNSDLPVCGAIDEIMKAGKSGAALTRQILTFSRRQIIQPEVLNLNVILKDTEKMLRRVIKEDIDLVMVLAPELWQTKVDPGQIEQMLMNLVVNAGDAMPTGGKLTIETENVELDKAYFRDHSAENNPGPYVMMAVTDNGIGMDEETRSRIFDPFFTTKEKGKGTGLGLSTVYGIAKQNKGYVWVYSEPGKGTTFKVYLPRVEAEVTSPQKQKAPAKSVRGSETVLVVEDDEMLRSMIKRILEKYGYGCLMAQNGEEGLRIFEENEDLIRLILTDVVMPGMSGQKMAKKLQSKHPGIKVIYMSGYTDNAIVCYGVLDEGTNFMQKPFTPEGLARKVREVIDSEMPGSHNQS